MALSNPGVSFTDAQVLGSFTQDRLTVGEYVPADRGTWSATSTGSSQTLNLTFWTADKTEAINNVRVFTSATAAAATPTLCRMGIYSTNAAGDLVALLASCANDTTLFAAANTAYTRALTSTFNKVAGVRYATALLVVSAATMPTFVAAASHATAFAPMFELPALAARVTAQSDLAASYTRAQQISFPTRVGFTLT